MPGCRSSREPEALLGFARPRHIAVGERLGDAKLLASAPALRGEGAYYLGALTTATDASDLGASLWVTVSVGIASCRAGEAAIEALARRADEALYRAKTQERSRFELAGGGRAAEAAAVSARATA